MTAAYPPAGRDDDVGLERDVQLMGEVAQLVGHRMVLSGRRRIAARVVVGQDEADGCHVQRSAQDGRAARASGVRRAGRQRSLHRDVTRLLLPL
ncbi:hypothetical protein BE18_15800 [Sorangium cellulosum]|uniref:Uncharacterized protein n=1 Tax=Sorangium cellulosum TaxID=56 RepID=A0A150RB40_SORCE|nr:hypothetical protein BE18_15800 [Sorangium cellulosum]